MEQHVELVVLQTETAVDEQDDAQIEELLSSFYFDNSVTRQSAGEGSRHGEHLHPIYEEQEEDGIFYDLYGTVEEESPCSICESSDEENDSEISSQYGPKELPPNIAQNPSSFWPVIEEDDGAPDAERITFSAKLSSSRSPSNIILEKDDEDDNEKEWEDRGRSRAVPARLVRYIDSSTKQEHDRREEWIDDQEFHILEYESSFGKVTEFQGFQSPYLKSGHGTVKVHS
ncbi:hypothetical protein F5879DRAFT_918608 [Lentinula edodes]|nr:hypothetical protein F5879DRAFT_918608 [Lentinula edodes]